MKKFTTSSKGGGRGSSVVDEDGSNEEEIECEVRPGGMLVQKREDDGFVAAAAASGPTIKLRISHGSSHHQINVPAQATFGDLKRLLAQETGLEAKEQRLLFRGKEKEDEEYLHLAGVKEMSKVVLLEDPASKERKITEPSSRERDLKEPSSKERKLEEPSSREMNPEEMKMDEQTAKACEAVVKVRSEVDNLAEKVSLLELSVQIGDKVADKEFILLTEFLMVQLLKLDGIKADGEAKVQRRAEVRRVQSLVEKLDNLKAENSKPLNSENNSVSVTTKWETFEGGMGSLSAPSPAKTTPTQDWEQFD